MSRPRAACVLLSAVLAAPLLAACGANGPAGEDASPLAPGSSQPAGTASPGTTGPASEVRLARVGGLAGFQDVLVVEPDGHVTGTTRAGAVDCVIPAGTVQVLATAAPPTTGLNAGNDRIASSVERGGTTFDLGETQGSDPLSTTARALLDDVQQPEGQRTLCR